MQKRFAILAGAAALLGGTAVVYADPVPRATPVAGSVIARKSGEEARFIEVGSFQTVDVRQDLKAGDVLRTNAAGNLAILFSDRTQIRLGRNSTLVVKAIGGNGSDTEFSLEAGQLWARAERGGDGVAVQTPAATAAIRGTDWSMQVNGDQTSLVVLDGQVDFFNGQGSLSLSAGQGASARIGQAPTRVVDVNPEDREQYLYYYSLRSAFTFLPATTLSARDLRRERDRISALAEEERTAADRVTLAEAALSLDGRQAAQAAVASARRLRLSRTETARLLLVEGILAGAARRDAEASELFARAAPRLDPQRRAVALYGGYFSRALADPDRAEAPPATPNGGPYGALAEAFTASFLQDIPAAIRILRDAEARFPDSSLLPAIRAQFAVLAADRAQAEEAIARALALDPDDPTALNVRAVFRSDVQSDLEGALADARRGLTVAPGSSQLWATLADVQDTRGGARETEDAFRRAIALDPEDPGNHANYAVFLLLNDRPEEAKREIDLALAADPTLDVVLTARGRYRLQKGDIDGAIQDFLASSTANPTFAAGLLILAAGYYENGDREGAQQALDNADRLDPNDPTVSVIRTAFAIDQYDSDGAIAAAQESLRRARARGGDYASLSANRDQGSVLTAAFALQGLDSWGRFYSDVTFDPFSATSLTDQGQAGSPDPFLTDLDFGGRTTEPEINSSAFPLYLQGVLLDPGILASPQGSPGIFRRPFVETSVGGGFVAPDGGETGWTSELAAQGFGDAPFPVSFFGQVSTRESGDTRERDSTLGPPLNPFDSETSFDLGDRDGTGIGYLAFRPTPVDSVFAYVDYRQDGDAVTDGRLALNPRVPAQRIDFETDATDRSLSTGVALSHTFGYRNVAGAGLFGAGYKRDSEQQTTVQDGVTGVPGVRIEGSTEGEFEQSVLIGAVWHSIAAGDVTFRYGVEGGRVAQDQKQNTTALVTAPIPVLQTSRDDSEVSYGAGRIYLDMLYEASPALKLEAGLFGTLLRPATTTVTTQAPGGVPIVSEAQGEDVDRFEPRLGLSFEVLPGQLLRLGYLRETGAFAAASAAPVGVVGLQSNQLPLSVFSYADTAAVRWDAEWTDHFFTSIDYQHQEFQELNIPVPLPFPGDSNTADVSKGRLDRVSATANLHLDGGFGLFATVAHTDSSSAVDGVGATGALPYVPTLSGRAGVTFVSRENVKVTVAESYVGDRPGSLGGADVDDYVTTDAFLTWEPFDKRFQLELAGYNLFNEKFEVARGEQFNLPTDVPGWSRTFTGSLKVRF